MKLFVQHAYFNIRKWFFSIHIVDNWNCLPSSVVNAPNVMCFEKRFDKCWADLKIKFHHEAPLIYSEFNYTKINTPQNIDFDSELSVEAMPFSCVKTCEYETKATIIITLRYSSISYKYLPSEVSWLSVSSHHPKAQCSIFKVSLSYMMHYLT